MAVPVFVTVLNTPPPPPPAVVVIEQPPPRQVPQQVARPEAGTALPRLPRAWAKAFDYHRDASIGGGSFAKIFRIIDKRSGETSALKVMERQFYASRQMDHQLHQEIEGMKKCAVTGRTRHVAKLLDATEENGLVYVRMELCNFSLETHALQQPGRRITEQEVAPWAQQLFLGLQDLLSVGIVHRDIKPENLLLGFDGNIKIVDFGWCASLADLRKSRGALAGTFQFMAPEILEEIPHTEAVDVWSSGATLLELLTGQPLITSLQQSVGPSVTCPRQAAQMRTARVLAEIRHKCPLPHLGKPNYLSSRCWSFCQVLLVPEVAARISVPNALGHPWLSQGLTHCRSWTPPARPPLADVTPNDQRQFPRAAHRSKSAHGRSWDGSTTASSSGTPRHRQPDQQCQVLNWGSVVPPAPPRGWPALHQPPVMLSHVAPPPHQDWLQ